MASPPKTGAKGFAMEESLRAYFIEAGYFVVRGLPYRLDGEDVTDVDLWLYERPAAATRRRILVDIKNKKSPKAAERIIWVKGLQAALGADGAIVATTDRRPSSRRLAKSLGIILFDGDAVAKVSGAKRIANQDALTSEEFDEGVKRVDELRRSSDWRVALQDARGSLLVGMGVHSANRCLESFGFFAQQAVAAHPSSPQAAVAIRLAYLTAALAMVSLDFVVADHAFRSIDERRLAILNSVRFGQAEASPALGTVKAALSLARKYLPNGSAVAKQIELGFQNEADEIPAEIIADFVARVSNGDTMFNIARELESASSNRGLFGFDSLSNQSRAALGAFLDFSDVSREAFANGWPRSARRSANSEGLPGSDPTESSGHMPAENPPAESNRADETNPVSDNGPLFSAEKPTTDIPPPDESR